MSAGKTLAIILGAGPGTGAAVGRAFAKDHAVALLARTPSTLDQVAKSITDAGGVAAPFACDASSPDSLKSAFTNIRAHFPNHQLKVAVFNVNAPFVLKPFLELSDKEMTTGIDLNIMGAFHFSQQVLPLMLEHKTGGTLIFTGATASLKGGAKFAAFAPSKFALRGLSQNLAREFGPQGVHVAHSIIDGLIDTSAVAKFAGEGAEASRISPEAIANAYVYLAQQDKSAWTQEIDLRPFAEKF
ncbi:short-chain dehydrogenase/reductase SDR family protein [Pseudohyphozyma bogoriensis]|nr:short-chain dehydrogenase/reductase SDR family protein [Pseudohyphozyma bogoriensis]